MAIAHVNGDFADNKTVSKPVNVVADDVIVAVMSATVAGAFTWPAGWIVQATGATNGFKRIEIATLVYASGTSWTVTTGGVGVHVAYAYRGVDKFRVFGDKATVNTPGAGTTIVTPTIDVPAGALAIGCFVANDGTVSAAISHTDGSVECVIRATFGDNKISHKAGNQMTANLSASVAAGSGFGFIGALLETPNAGQFFPMF